jgi:arylsulfatase A-like enzyme
LLQASGYLTCGIIGTNVVRDAAKADVGFDIFLDNYNLKTSKDFHTVQADTIVNETLGLLSKFQASKKPMFLWLFFKDPHWPYLPPVDFREQFLYDAEYGRHRQELSISVTYHDSLGGVGEARLTDEGDNFVTDKAYYIAQYDSEIFFMDAQIGRIIEYLKQRGDYEEWVIILMADHGESLGEEDYFFDHGYKLMEATTRIPLLIKLPRSTKNEKVDVPVSICDIYPTILRLSDSRVMPKVSQSKGGLFFLRGNAVRRTRLNRDSAIMLENDPGHERENNKFLACIFRQHKLVYNKTANEKILYDISAGEKKLEKFGKKQERAMQKMTALIEDFFTAWISTDSEKLRSLGYIQ